MLFTYPPKSTTNNWLHECLDRTLENIHYIARKSKRYPTWPNIIPDKKRRNALKDYVTFDVHFRDYYLAFKTVSITEQNRISRALKSQNNIVKLLSGEKDCSRLRDLPKKIQNPIRKLFEYSYKTLKVIGLTKSQYEVIHEDIVDKTCPFCGCEFFDDPDGRREAMDHYLTASIYPFSAVNLRNLVPMGTKCNSRHKGQTDLLRKTDGSSRIAIDPYGKRTYRISLNNSVPFGGTDGMTPDWVVTIDPDDERSQTWNDVFHVKERYINDVLNHEYKKWIPKFKKWRAKRGIPNRTDRDLFSALQIYCEDCELYGYSEGSFLRAATFRMLLFHCRGGDQRLIKYLRLP